MKQTIIKPYEFNSVSKKLRNFFENKNFIETYPQCRQSIMAACEDPKTISTYKFSGTKFPMIQTNQMWLEHDLLSNPEMKTGVYCLTTSYRNEPNPIEGRHDLIFPMFEFERKGNFEDLLTLLKELVIFLGFDGYKQFTYEELCKKYNVDILTHDEEEKMWKDYGDVVIITEFPYRTDPFWNMKKIEGTFYYNKADFIICGKETFGTAQRSISPKEMLENFYTISKGEYSKILFDNFTEERVMEELNEYLSFNMFDRFGGGIGITRLLKAMKIKNLI